MYIKLLFQVLPTIPKEQRTRVAYFLEKQGFKQQALAVSSDPEHRFELAIQLSDMKVSFCHIFIWQYKLGGFTWLNRHLFFNPAKLHFVIYLLDRKGISDRGQQWTKMETISWASYIKISIWTCTGMPSQGKRLWRTLTLSYIVW